MSKPKQKKRIIKIPKCDYQPSKAELEEEFDMPEAGKKEIRSAFFRPFKAKRKK